MKNNTPIIGVEPDAWASKRMCIGASDNGKVIYSRLPIQSLNPLSYTHEKLYSEKSVIGLMKAAHYDGYTDREQELRDSVNGDSVKHSEAQSTIATLQAQLAERDKTILEPQASSYKDAKLIRQHLETIDELKRVASEHRDGRLAALEKLAALESALASERLAGKIEGVEEAAVHLDGFPIRLVGDSSATQADCANELRRMAAELKEGK